MSVKQSFEELVQKPFMSAVVGSRFGYKLLPRTIYKKALDGHGHMIHLARVKMVESVLPPGAVILDLGGANCPLYKMGYPHKFKKLILIDLPPEKRHEMYKEIKIDTTTSGGEVVVKYGDMTELDAFEDNSVDFVWSGQSIEHVPFEAGEKMCNSAYRVLKPGGAFCLDTPNRLITSVHTRDVGGGFIHPEHFIEYEPKELRKMLLGSGFQIVSELGICEMKNTAKQNRFFYEDFLYGRPITRDIDSSYIQYFHCIKK